jgi:hypothetical protein
MRWIGGIRSTSSSMIWRVLFLIAFFSAWGEAFQSKTSWRLLEAHVSRIIDDRSSSPLTHAIRPSESRRSHIYISKDATLPTFLDPPRVIHDDQTTTGVPRTMSQALHTFFIQHTGPPLVVLTWMALCAQRLQLSTPPFGWMDAACFVASVLFWWWQEHFLHKYVLHSSWDHMGKRIHQAHHQQPYHHVSIEPAWLILTWLTTVHVVLRCLLPLPYALSATLGYVLAGMGYMWWHFVVHTRIRFPPHSYAARVQAHHARHHCVDDRYWFAFSALVVDDVLRTNPDVATVRK